MVIVHKIYLDFNKKYLNSTKKTFFVFCLGSVVRQRVVNFMRLNHKTVEEAEGFYGLDVDFYLNDVSAATAASGSEPSLK